MADVTTFPDLLEAALPDDLGFYDGFVPKMIPETEGYIDPYVVLWGGVGDNPFEPTACGTHSTDTLIWDFQLSVVAASATACRQAAREVLASVINLSMGTGRVKPNPDGYNQQSPLLDTQTSPARFLLPLQLRLTTN